MGKGKVFATALKSRVTPTGRWAPKANGHARCVGLALAGKTGGGKNAVRQRFVVASKECRGK